MYQTEILNQVLTDFLSEDLAEEGEGSVPAALSVLLNTMPDDDVDPEYICYSASLRSWSL